MNYLYIFSLTVRLILLLFSHYNYIEDNEHTLTSEIVVGDILQIKHDRTWQFNSVKPINSISIQYLLYYIPIYIYSTLTQLYTFTHLSIFIKLSSFIQTLAIDYFIFKSSFYLKCQKNAFNIYLTSHILYTYFSGPCISIPETVFFSFLLFICITHSIKVKENLSKGHLAILAGMVYTFGLFTNVLFGIYALILILWLFLWIFSNKPKKRFSILWLLMDNLKQIMIGCLLALFYIVVFDSIYYGYLKVFILNGQSEKNICEKNLIPEIVTKYVHSILSVNFCISGKLIFTPYYQALYLLEKNPSQYFSNYYQFFTPLFYSGGLFGPLITLAFITLLRLLWRLYKTFNTKSENIKSRLYKLMKFYQFSLILTLFIIYFTLFLVPVITSSHILPISIILFILAGYGLEYYYSKRIRKLFYFVWISFNFLTFFHFTFLHEVGVKMALNSFQTDLIHKVSGIEDCSTPGILTPCAKCNSNKPCHYNFIFLRTFSPPTYLLAWPNDYYRSHNVEISYFSELKKSFTSKVNDIQKECANKTCNNFIISPTSNEFVLPKGINKKEIRKIFPHYSTQFSLNAAEILKSYGQTNIEKSSSYKWFKILQLEFAKMNRISDEQSLRDEMNRISHLIQKYFSLSIYSF